MEFALVAIPFFFVVFAILETAILTGAGILLNNAVDKLAREVMTGQLLTADVTAERFREKVCEEVDFMLDCVQLQLDLRTFSASEPISPAALRDLTSIKGTGSCFNPGAQNSITVLRAFYAWPWRTAFLQVLATETSGSTILFSMQAFMNEPFGAAINPNSNCA